MIEMSQAAKAENSPAQTIEELEERLSIRIGSPVRVIVDQLRGTRRSGILEYLEFPSNRANNPLILSFRGTEKPASIYYALEQSYETLVDGNWRPIHLPPRRSN